MVEVEMTKDIRDYEAKLFGLVTVRQVVCIAIGLAYAVPLALLLPFDVTTRLMVAAIAMTPVIIAGWVSVYGMRFEQFLGQIIKSVFLTPSKLKYKTESSIPYLKYETSNKIQMRNKKKKIKKSPEFKGRK